MPTTIPNVGWVGPPTPRTVGAMGTQRVKVENFCYIVRSSRPRPAGARQYYTNSGALCCTHKISTDIRPMCPPFHTGGKMSQILAQNFDTDSPQTDVFLNCGALSENKNKLVNDR